MATEKQKVQLQRWKALIQDRINSNLTIMEWCELNNVGKDAYYYWLKRVRKEAVAKTDNKKPVIAESNSFVEIQPVVSQEIMSTHTNSKPSAIIRKDGFEIELFNDTSPVFIRQLLEAVRYA